MSEWAWQFAGLSQRVISPLHAVTYRCCTYFLCVPSSIVPWTEKKRKDPALPSDARRWHMSPGANIVRVCVYVYVSVFVCVLVLGKQIIKYMPSWTAVRCVNSPWIQCRCVCACVCVCERRTLEAFPASNSKLETTLLGWLWLWLPLGRLRRRADAALSGRGRY